MGRRHLRDELHKFVGTSRRSPKYYIFATNVVLTPDPNGGSLDVAIQVLETDKRTLGLRGYAAWSYDQLRTFLDGIPALRATYAAWITPGDVLQRLLRRPRSSTGH